MGEVSVTFNYSGINLDTITADNLFITASNDDVSWNPTNFIFTSGAFTGTWAKHMDYSIDVVNKRIKLSFKHDPDGSAEDPLGPITLGVKLKIADSTFALPSGIDEGEIWSNLGNVIISNAGTVVLYNDYITIPVNPKYFTHQNYIYWIDYPGQVYTLDSYAYY